MISFRKLCAVLWQSLQPPSGLMTCRDTTGFHEIAARFGESWEIWRNRDNCLSPLTICGVLGSVCSASHLVTDWAEHC
ncbi:hypothetical protein RRG08_014231 [Elysia crispata]|uniref:Uncharacterized protein n=1 Tax=Elysia crispata TaxID=231223 RepID=A0AAE0XEF3_9GAST|nr:hypothetical protein RRG08_014231 [Elysia crispata]